MTRRIGILLLDWTDVVVRVYEKEESSSWKIIFSYTKDLSLEPNILSSASIFIAIINEAALKGAELHVQQWEIYTRYLPKQIIYEIAQTIAFPIKRLTLQQEQDLLCKGTLLELQ